MTEFFKTVTIVNKRGLHARASAKFVKMAESFESEVIIIKERTSVLGTSIMGLLMLGAGIGSEITIRTDGDDAEKALEDLSDLVIRGFDET